MNPALIHHITVPKTARYAQYGELTDKTEFLWVVLHGYGQLAPYFIRSFHALDPQKHIVVAPEGLHRFYNEGFSGRVGASWMTKEERETDIADYVAYLDLLLEHLQQKLPKHLRRVVLGFSQGAATAGRWVCNGKVQPHHFVLWSGAFPSDVPLEVNAEIMSKQQNWLVCGDNDPFISAEQFEAHRAKFVAAGIDHQTIRFEGDHRINQEALLKLEASL